jgi:hypothetical protein
MKRPYGNMMIPGCMKYWFNIAFQAVGNNREYKNACKFAEFNSIN